MAVSGLQRGIINTISYFDIFEYPLTLIEIYKWLYAGDWHNVALSELTAALADLEDHNLIEQQEGFYFLAGSSRHINTRLRRYRITEPKFKIALKAGRLLRYIPFVKMIAVCNNVGYNNCRENSDIDFFIIAKTGRLWLVRLLVTLVLSLFRLRRHGKYDANRVCLSFYLANQNQNLAPVALKPDDIYLVYWLATLAPIYQAENDYQTFFLANSWQRDFLPNFYSNILSNRRIVADTKLSLNLKNYLEKSLAGQFGNWFSRLAKKIQLKKVTNYFGPLINHSDGNVVIDERTLKFHKTDRRKKYLQLWQTKI
ncbi:MAG: hypothetical protein JW816_01330, partial [Candidatus Buchananbacteria bacterium]|nr:hypothetical protein [Candidatus Buchananbacteria bacterium]